MSELYRDYIDGKADKIITALGGTITPAPANAELYRDFLDRKFDDVINSIDNVLPIGSASGNPVTFYTSLSKPLVACNIAVNAWQEGSGDPSPSNVRPIHGFSEVNAVNMTGTDKAEFFRGLLRGECAYVDMSALKWQKYAGDNTGYSFYVNVPSNASQVSSDSEIADILSNKYATTNYSIWTTWQTKDKVICQVPNAQRWIARDTDYTSVADFKSALSGKYLIYKLAIPVTPTITKNEFEMLVSAFGLSDNIYTIQLGQEVYGAEVDVVNGVAHVKNALVDLGSLTWVASEGFHYAVINNGIYGTNLKAAKAICDHYKIVRGQDFASTNNAFCYGLNNRPQLWVNDSNLNSLSASDFKTAISNTFVVYELATPFDIQLTPTQIKTIIGNNTIFADTGGNIDIKYRCLPIDLI